MSVGSASVLAMMLAALTLPAWSEASEEHYFRPGDSRLGYESKNYKSDSLSLQKRKGQAADLYHFYQQPQLGLPQVPVPADNPQTAAGISLGRLLFFDRRLSLNNTISCAMCHVPEMGFANNEIKTAIGFEGRTVRRNAPSVLNAAFRARLFHDGREHSLENQIWSPLLASNEMANPSVGYVVRKIMAIKDYNGLFEKAFNGKKADMNTISMALAQYQRTLVAGNSAFDRWRYGKDERALNEQEKQGFAVFTGPGRCVVCHTVGEQHALFSDDDWHNTGIGYRESMMVDRNKPVKVQLAPGVFTELDRKTLDQVTQKPKANDLGLYEMTQNPADRWKYLTPSLRNVELTAPYMHDGSLADLKMVIEFYNRGGIKNQLLDPLLSPLNLGEEEKHALLAFLKTLTARESVALLVNDAFAAPVGDLSKDDPFWANEVFWKQDD